MSWQDATVFAMLGQHFLHSTEDIKVLDVLFSVFTHCFWSNKQDRIIPQFKTAMLSKSACECVHFSRVFITLMEEPL